MSNNADRTPQPIEVDPGYRIRDNQFWYSDCTFAEAIRGCASITVRIAGLGIRELTHAARGRDGHLTTSFKLPGPDDVAWWRDHRGESVRVELLGVSADSVEADVSASVTTAAPAPVPPPPAPMAQERPRRQPAGPAGELECDQPVLCIGLDVAWFGGSRNDRHSRYDCLASTVLGDEAAHGHLELRRVALGTGRDPEAKQTLQAVRELIDSYDGIGQVIFAIDAPIQARDRPQLGVRLGGGRSPVERRAAENWLSAHRQEIDRSAGGAGGWHPNIQPGAPLATRVIHLLNGLVDCGFELWTADRRNASRLVIECFPAEAIWAARRFEGFRPELTAPCVKAYKKQNRTQLGRDQVETLADNVLHGFATPTGNPPLWESLRQRALEWMLADGAWQTRDGQYRGGKLLDDVVDTMICLATSLSYAGRCAHVWFDPDDLDDGHIIGPGFRDDGRWTAAWPSEND